MPTDLPSPFGQATVSKRVRAAVARAPAATDPAGAAAALPVAVQAEGRPVPVAALDRVALVQVAVLDQAATAPAAVVPVDPDRVTVSNKEIRVQEWGWKALLPSAQIVYFNIRSFIFLNSKLSFINKITPFFPSIHKFLKKSKKKCNLLPSSAFNG